MPKLVVLSEGFTGRTHELTAEKTTVGRVEDNTICIPEASVSSHHCEILLRGGEVVVHDLNSTNGTFIGGNLITESVLKAGQILRLGNLQMRLEGDRAASQAPKKQLDQTMVLQQGIKLNELETGGAKPTSFPTDSQFIKKSNKTNMIFIVVGILLALVVIGLLVYAFMQGGDLNTPP